jgi:glycosyltransferase involved in cell wall biosynthesis
MKESLSILIPTFNDDCLSLVEELERQCAVIAELRSYEILVADDGSTNQQVVMRNEHINQLPHCRYIRYEENRGRASIRNVLAQLSLYQWLLFIDGDMRVSHSDFIRNYLTSRGNEVVYGGYQVSVSSQDSVHLLRYLYERQYENSHSVEVRRKQPYRQFHTSNFLVLRTLYLANPLDERFLRYGYEDVLWGKMLEEKNVSIEHIHNPVSFELFESNMSFIRKSEEALQTLYQFRDSLRGYSSLTTFVEKHRWTSLPCRVLYRLLGKSIRSRLCGNHPSVMLFKVYKLLYYQSLNVSETTSHISQ